MQYRKFGSLEWKPSALGFGCMRLPTNNSNPENINERESIKMIRYAIDMGVNYVDTAYPYHNGNSEIVTGKALKDGYRQKVKLATKSPIWLVNKAGDFDRILDEQLQKLQTDHIDFYLLHSLGRESWQKTLRLGLLERAETAVKNGKVGYIGFSFHDNNASFTEILNGYDKWAFCQIQYNYMDIKNQAGIKGLKDAASKGLAVIVMEPLLGGRLSKPPVLVREAFESFETKRTPSEWALKWIWNQPEVSLILSGMTSMEQVVENINSAKTSGINTFTGEELSLIELVRDKFNERMPIPCTKCGYCIPCPSGVNIPRIFELYNDGIIYDEMNGARFAYTRFTNENERANLCIECRTCEEKCPQKIPISGWMPKIHSILNE